MGSSNIAKGNTPHFSPFTFDYNEKHSKKHSKRGFPLGWRLVLLQRNYLNVKTIPQVNWDKELDEEADKQRRRKKESQKTTTSQSALPPVKKPEVVPQLPKPRSSVSPKPNRTSNNSATLDLLGLGKLNPNILRAVLYFRDIKFKRDPCELIWNFFKRCSGK